MSVNWFHLFPQQSDNNPTLTYIAERCLPMIASLDWRQEDCLVQLQKAREQCLNAVAERQDAQQARVIVSTLCDLRGQGWEFRFDDGRILALRPSFDVDADNSIQDIKAKIRAGLLLERDVQLQKPTTRRFVREMERQRLGPNGWVSIYSLMRDGQELADKLEQAAKILPGPRREGVLRQVIDPYIQVVDDSRCELTWLKLKDIWRYFRYTWSTPSQSVPGRNIWFLIRDRAAEHHPVIGIAALGSAIVQMKERDQWIGWHRRVFLQHLEEDPSREWAIWIHRSLDDLIAEIYIKDFLEAGLLTREELLSPTAALAARLNEFATEQRDAHRLYPEKGAHKSDISNADWEARAETFLFKSKRARTLAKLLEARRKLQEADFSTPTADGLKQALQKKPARDAIASILRRVKATHVGVSMMDITVCGAIPPYNPILGGKLVSLLMTSPEVVNAYRERYENQPSIIASSMAGRAVVREQNLVLLGTTSLYGVGSSQYNRLRIPAEAIGGQPGSEVRFQELDKTEGYGSFHLSSATLAEIAVLSARRAKGRRVNSIFGEGVNPRLRKVREALDEVGFDSDAVLQHENRRIIYGVALASNFRKVLLGRDRDIDWILPVDDGENATCAIAQYWTRRWLMKRIDNGAALTRVALETKIYPVRHGARVTLPVMVDEEQLFSI